ncbi:Gelsolin-like protein 1 [Aphelenchoides besseyi]|nr:Gelsolin-like protein 1 [Aphelenchoides besseyi]KAI6209476.1 Gelsolin-like protein 1 [Aphelenchoides besseyi]
MAPTVDPKFENAGKKIGLEIWRVKKFDLEVVPKEQFGNFYTGDSYIVLNTKTNDSFDLHFWLGSETTQDEAGSAAIFSVALDDSLGGIPVQYREVQNHESALFLSYFKSGITYLQGGHATGFNHVVDNYENWKPRLFQCKGKRNVRCVQVDQIKESLNLGDAFILDLGTELYVWCPPESGRLERVKAVEYAQKIRDQERAGKPKIEVLDENWNTKTKFWDHFGGVQMVGWIKTSRAGGVDVDFWRDRAEELTLYKVSDATGKIELTKIRQGALKFDDLKSEDVFILDAQSSGIYVWIGKKATAQERSKAMHFGQDFLIRQARPPWFTIVKVLDGAEPDTFKQWFSDLTDQKKTTKFQPKLYHVSNETGKMVVEEIANFYQEDLDIDDVFVLDALNVVYVWIGDEANKAEKDMAESTAQTFLKTSSIPRHKKAEVEVLFQGKETPGFTKLFPEWDPKMWAKKEKDYKNLRNLLFQQ